VHVGPQKETHNIHKHLICRASPYFNAAFKGGFKETEESSLPLEDVHVEDFRAFLEWLYSGTLMLPPKETAALAKSLRGSSRLRNSTSASTPDRSSTVETLKTNNPTRKRPSTSRGTHTGHQRSKSTSDKEKEVLLPEDRTFSMTEIEATLSEVVEEADLSSFGSYERAINILLDYYIFGDRYDVPEFRLDVLRYWQSIDAQALDARCGWFIAIPTIIKAYESLPRNCGLVRYIVDQVAYRWMPDRSSEEEIKLFPRLPQDLLLRVVCINARRFPYLLPDEKDPFDDWCRYHNHLTESEIKACQNKRRKDDAAKIALQDSEAEQEAP
jgi:hypothetical protein